MNTKENTGNEINVMFLPYRFLAKELHRKDCWKQYLNYERSRIERERSKCQIDFLKNIHTNRYYTSFSQIQST